MQVHAYLSQIGLCGTSGYLTPYDLRTWPDDIPSALNTTTLSELNTSNECSATSKIVVLDYFAMVLQGFIWRVLAYWALWLKLRPEAPGLYTLLKRYAVIFYGWFVSEVKAESKEQQRHVRATFSSPRVAPEPQPYGDEALPLPPSPPPSCASTGGMA